jgi:inorganic triphosphatase YgiF
MRAPREIELKLEVPPARLPELHKIPQFRALEKDGQTRTEVSVYFDTDKQKLRKKGLMLRVRRIGKRHIQTIKAAGDMIERGEWECEIPTDTPDLDLARETALAPLLSRKLSRQLRPMFETKVRRTSCQLSDDDHSVTVSVDRGRIQTGERSQPLCEIELELDRGDKGILFELARELMQASPVQLGMKSKAERGYELAEREELRPVKTVAVRLDPDVNAREGFRAVGSACLKQIAGNVPVLLAGDAEGVHQMRVGLRRLRAAISLFGAILVGSDTGAVKREAKWLTAELSRARELDVLVTRVVAPIRQRHARLGLRAFSQELDRQRAAASDRAKEAVQSARFRRLLLDIAAWLETGQWTKPQDDLVKERGDLPMSTFAAAELARRWKKISKRAKKLQQLDPGRRHKLRIQGKKLRYASEFFAGLFPSKKASKRHEILLSRLEDVQDCLGDLNDIVVHEGLMAANASLDSPPRPRLARKRVFAAGLLSGREDARFDAVFERATRACSALAKVEPFW